MCSLHRARLAAVVVLDQVHSSRCPLVAIHNVPGGPSVAQAMVGSGLVDSADSPAAPRG